MLIIVAIIGSFLALAAFALFISMTVYDMRLIQVNRRILHFRRQPLVSVVVESEHYDAALKSIKQSDYRKYEVVYAGEPIKGDIVLKLKHDSPLAPTSIRYAVQQLYNLPGCTFVELKPLIKMPSNMRQLFKLYERAVLAPFISVRAQLDIRPLPYSKWSVVQHATIKHTWRTYAYHSIVWLSSVINAVVLAYLIYLASWLNQPEFLLLYIAAFGLWLIVSLWDYPYFSVSEKLLYTAISPVSFFYFFLLAFKAPFVIPARMISVLAKRHFSRSIDMTVV